MNSKRKGSAAEREIAGILTAAGFPAHRNDQRFTGGSGNPDISALGLEGYHFEVKRCEKLNLHAALAQAERDAASGAIPAVVHRRSREPWFITLPLTAFLAEVKKHDTDSA